MRLPNVFLAGCQKSGSTSLAEYLSAHPDCLLSNPKENAFFSKATNLENLGGYTTSFTGGGSPHPRVILDATTENMANPRAAAFIAGALGTDVKLIFMLRAPAARVYSGYLHLYKRGHERREPGAVLADLGGDQDQAEQTELRRLARALVERRISPEPYKRRYDDYLWSFRYIANTGYRRQVARYEAQFGAANVLVLTLEDALRSPEAMRGQLSRFLDLDPSGFPTALPHENPTSLPEQPSLRSRIARIVKRRPNAVDVIPVPVKADPAIARALTELFRGETQYWSERLGADLAKMGW
ncbi:hypothetical protein QO010_000871 [Caulobacter ginsengisoli]|uniref:Sulfotransferase domain-containing protein n=1 Tax=Caulobacter ginsengisoli TaxID=400775 RepID=A0ABU0IPM9_9CAUL|nr:sulfotransferase domain-containing protein [Caulobacter ginsengisoli]MDQ0463123.1 hypothetical protein [Caulobacter ginsengisoli]